MALLLYLKQGVATLFDFAAIGDSGLLSWTVDAYGDLAGQYAKDSITFHFRGTSNDDLLDNAITLNRVLALAAENERIKRDGGQYTPIYLVARIGSATNTVQSEIFGESLSGFDNLVANAVYASRLENITFTVKRQPYFEESALVSITGSPFTVSNSGGLISIPAEVRGDLPAPLYIKTRAGAASATRLAAGLRARGTVANWIAKYEAESATLGSGVALLADANLSPGSGNTAAQWTPAVTTEQALCGWTISANVADQFGKFRVLVRARDNAAAVNTKIRVKAGIYNGAYSLGAAGLYGEWGYAAQYVSAVAGTTVLPLVDCGVITLPPADTAGVAVAGLCLEIWGKATATGVSYKFDVDCIYLIPCSEGAGGSGFYSAQFPIVMGTGVQPDGVLDANDNQPAASIVDGSDVLQFPAQADGTRGRPLFAWPNLAQKLIVLAFIASNGNHNWNVNNTITVKYRPRYRIGRGS